MDMLHRKLLTDSWKNNRTWWEKLLGKGLISFIALMGVADEVAKKFTYFYTLWLPVREGHICAF